jgi:hypothetical protein
MFGISLCYFLFVDIIKVLYCKAGEGLKSNDFLDNLSYESKENKWVEN